MTYFGKKICLREYYQLAVLLELIKLSALTLMPSNPSIFTMHVMKQNVEIKKQVKQNRENVNRFAYFELHI